MPHSTLQGIFTKRGAENETRTRSCKTLIVKQLQQHITTSGETWVKLSWPFETYLGYDLNGRPRKLSCHEQPYAVSFSSPLQDYTAVVITCLSLRFLGTAESIFHVRAVIGCYIDGKDRP